MSVDDVGPRGTRDRGLPAGSGPGAVLVFTFHSDGFKDASFPFPVGLEDIGIDQPSRSTVTQSLGAKFLFHLGSGLGTITIAGTTGWRSMDMAASYPNGTAQGSARSADQTMGFLTMTILGRLLQNYNDAFSGGSSADLRLLLNNPTGAGAYTINPIRLRVTRNKARPMLFMFELDSIILKDLTYGGGDDAITLAALQSFTDITALAQSTTAGAFNPADTSNSVVDYATRARQDALGVANELAPSQILPYTTVAGDTINIIVQKIQSMFNYFTTVRAVILQNQGKLGAGTDASTVLTVGIVLDIPVVEAPPTG